MRHQRNWTFSGITALLLGVLTALLWWWLIMYEGMWPYIIFVWIPAVAAIAFGLYALKTYDSPVAFLAILLALSPLLTWMTA